MLDDNALECQEAQHGEAPQHIPVEQRQVRKLRKLCERIVGVEWRWTEERELSALDM
jgi:hypothetical protein